MKPSGTNPCCVKEFLDSCDPEKSRVDHIAQLHVDLAEAFAASTLQLIQGHDISRESIDLIGSHGHTLWHNVLPSGRVSVSLQIVEAAVIAERTGITTISNFRARDIALSGARSALNLVCRLAAAASSRALAGGTEYWRHGKRDFFATS